jgi:hypothetical protein
VKNIADLKARLKRASGGLIRFIPADGAMTVRFLTEPTGFIMYQDCWSAKDKKSFPFVDGMVQGKDFDRSSTVFLAKVIDTEKDVVVPLQLKQSVLNFLVRRFEQYGTLMDRDYEIARYGAKLETTYDVTPEAPSKKNLAKHQEAIDKLDLESVLQQAYEDAFPDEAADEDEPPARSRRARREEPEAEDDEPDEESEEPTVGEMKEMDWGELNEYARSIGVKTGGIGKRSVLIAAIEEKRDEF